ncbi:MAG: response regulator [Acidimicrobiia bacterium]
MTRVVIADDHGVVRTGLQALLLTDPEMDVVGLAADGDEAIELVLRHEPDVVLMDLSMPGTDGLTATKRILAAAPSTRIVVLTSFAERKVVLDALDAGAIGYLLKTGDSADVIRAVRAAARNEYPIDPRVAHVIVNARPDREAPPLTERERDVLRLLVDGLSNGEIARRLDIAEKTVKTHLTRVYQRMGVTDRAAAAEKAVRIGLVAPPSTSS